MEFSLIWQFNAMPANTANSTPCRFSTGSAPGNPRHTGHTLVFGGLPNSVEQPQKILVLVRSWTCTSRPITGSYFNCVATGASGVVTICSDYSGEERSVTDTTCPGSDRRLNLCAGESASCTYALRLPHTEHDAHQH